MTQNGKGDTPRPMKISRDQFGSNFDKIFRGEDIQPLDVPLTDEAYERLINQVANALKVPRDVLGIDK